MKYLAAGVINNASMIMSCKKQKKKPQCGDLVEMCWDPRYSELKMGIIVDFEDEHALVMWKEGNVTKEWPSNLAPISNRVRAEMAGYNIKSTKK